MTTPQISLFHCGPEQIRTITSLGTRLKECGINHVELDAVHGLHELPWCRENEWRVIALGDNFMRTPADREANCTKDKVSHSSQLLGSSGICDRLELVDEMNPDPRTYPPLKQFAAWWQAAGGPSIGCPSYSTQAYSRIPGLVGHHTEQWNWESAKTYKERWARLVAARSGVPVDDRPEVVQIPVVRQYRKGFHAGSQFRPGIDHWLNKGMTGKGIYKMMLDAADLIGIHRIHYRLYALEVKRWRDERAAAPVGFRAQVGIDLSDERWVWVEKAVRAIHALARKGSGNESGSSRGGIGAVDYKRRP